MVNSIPIFYSVDKNCYELALVSMTSVMENTKENVHFYILHSNLSQGIKLLLSTLNKYKNCEVSFKNIDEDLFKNFPVPKWVKMPAWFRILIPVTISGSKAIYLDCDTLVRCDIKELFNIDISDYLVAGVSDVYKNACRTKKFKFNQYINSGVLLLNCDLWRKVNLVNKIFALSKSSSDVITGGDQDMINIVTNDKTKLISPKFNYISTWIYNDYNEYKGDEKSEYELASKNPYIVHYTSTKPLDPRSCCHNFAQDWWTYAKKTSIYPKLLEIYKKNCNEILYDVNMQFYKDKFPSFWNRRKKTLIFITCSEINKACVSEYKKTMNISNCQSVLLIDNTKKKYKVNDNYIGKCSMKLYGETLNCVLFDKSLNAKLNLPFCSYNTDNTKFEDTMWYNADYRFYYIKEFYPDFDYYWQFDYDVFMNSSSYSAFLDRYNNNADIIVAHKPVNDNKPDTEWCWFRKEFDWAYDNDFKKYRCFLPACRLSHRAVDFLYKRRLELSDKFKTLSSDSNNKWIHCEFFTISELVNNGYTYKYLDEPMVWSPEYDLNEDRIFEKEDCKLYHPIKGNFIKRISNLENKLKNIDKV